MPSSRTINYRIGISADTSQLDAQLKSTLSSLTKLGTNTVITKELQQASEAALDLGNKLREAVNPKTGTLDLRSLNEGLARSKMTLKDYYDQLVSLGPAGQAAFAQVAQAITSAELPLKRTTKLWDSLWTTMKNTVRWQLTTSALRTFTGSIQTAYGYAKDLNESLSNIRIVTQKSTDDMARFAQRANEAAKALSTTTTNYTDASLIYYQQGLNDQQVQERTNATIKLANVAGITAESASEQLTAIWNNFDDGTRSLESYVDVMVKLGAETASSSSEISEGIRKFAAVADTVGLSYDYAAAALATVTATTRESADVVGTAYRTLFARIQGLQQGETMDDGTTLNKYSKALETVGIQIKDASGNLKDMDTILDELGARWQTLAKDQQVALAETVAGVRQYTQLVALMDNWDFFQENLGRAKNSEGALQEQADIYAESWEAARDRVRAAAEGIYDSFINPDLFIELDNTLVPVLETLETMIDAFGGLTGILPIVTNLMFQIYGDRIAQSMRDMVASSGVITATEAARARSLQAQAADLASIMSFENNASETTLQRNEALKQILSLQGEIANYMDRLTESQQAQLKSDYSHIQNLQAQLDKYTEMAAKAEQVQAKSQQSLMGMINPGKDFQKRLIDASNSLTRTNMGGFNYLRQQGGIFDAINVQRTPTQKGQANSKSFSYADITQKAAREQYEGLVKVTTEITRQQAVIKQLTTEAKNLDNQSGTLNEDMKKLAQSVGLLNTNASDEEVKKLFNDLQNGTGIVDANTKKFNALREVFINLAGGNAQAAQAVNQWIKAIQDSGINSEAANRAYEIMQERLQQIRTNMEQNVYATRDWATTIVNIGQTISQFAMALNSIRSIINIFDDNSMSTWDKFVAILTNVGMLMPTVITLTKSLGVATAATVAIQGTQVTVTGAGHVATWAKAAADKILSKAEGEVAIAAAQANAAFVAQLITLAPYIALFAGIAGAIGIAVAAHNRVAKAAKNAAEEINKTADAYLSAQQEVSSLNSELKTTQDRINEIKEQGTISLVEEEELQKLEQQEASLERQLELQKAIAAQEAEKTRRAINSDTRALQSGFDEYNENATRNQNVFASAYGVEAKDMSAEKAVEVMRQQVVDYYRSYYDEFRNATWSDLMNDETGIIDQDYLNNYVEDQAEQLLKEAEQALDEDREWAEKHQEDYDAYMEAAMKIPEAYSAILESYEDSDDYAAKADELMNDPGYKALQGILFDTVAQGDEHKFYRLFIQPAIDTTSLNDVAVQLGKLSTADIQGKAIDEVLAKIGIIGDDAQKIISYMVSTGIDLETLVGSVSSRVDELHGKLSGLGYDEYLDSFIGSLSGTDLDLALSIPLDDIHSFEQFYRQFRELQNNNAVSLKISFADALDAANSAINSFIAGEFLTDEQVEAVQEKFKDLFDVSNFAALSMYDQSRMLTEMLDQMANVGNSAVADVLTERVNTAKQNLEDIQQRIKSLEAILDTEPSDASMKKVKVNKKQIEQELKDLKLEKVDVSLDLQHAEDQLKELESFELDPLSIELDEASVNALLGQMSAIGKAAGLIDSNYQVAADKVEELSKTLPQVFEDAIVGPNGIVQLSKQAVEQVFSDAQQETEARRTSMEDILAARIAESNAEMDALRRLRDAAIQGDQEALTSGQIAAQQEQANKERSVRAIIAAKIQQAIQEKTATAQAASDAIHDQNEVTNASQENANLTAQNWWAAFTQIDSDALQHFQNVVKYQNDVAAGNTPTPVNAYTGAFTGVGTSGGSYKLSSTYDRVGDQYDNVRQYLKNFDINDVGESWEDWLKKYGSSASRGEYEKYRYDLANTLSEQISSLTGNTIDTLSLFNGEAFVDDFLGSYGDNLDKFITDLTAGMSDTGYELGEYTNWLSKLKAGASNYTGYAASSGKGSSKSAKTEDPLKPKTQADLEDRYHEIDRNLEDISSALEDIDNQSDRAFGQGRLNLYEKKLVELNKQVETYNDKLKLANHFLNDVDKPNLQKLIPNIQFGTNGEILNYQDVLDSLMNEYNAFANQYNAYIARYNAATAAEQEAMQAELDNWKKQKEVADEALDTKIDALKQYEDTLDTIQDIRDAWEDAQREIEDTKLAEVTYKMEVILEIKNAEDVIRDFDKQMTESFSDDLYHELYGKVFNEATGHYETSRDNGTLQKGYEQALAEAALLGGYQEEYAGLMERLSEANEFTDMDALKDAFLELSKNAISSAETLLDWAQSLEEALPNAIAAARDRFDQFNDQLEHNTSILEAIKELYELQGQTYKTAEGFDNLQRNAAVRMDAALKSAQANRAWNDRAAAELAQAQAALDNLYARYGGDKIAAESDVTFDTLKANRDALLEEFNTSQEALYESATQAMEIARDMYLEQIEKATYDFGQELSNGVGLDLLADKYDHFIESNDRYLDSINEAYEVASWYNKLQADIDKSTNANYTKQLQALQQEIDLRREAGTLSQYDLDILEAKYKALQAQMALEDAQNAKTTLRLVRDRQGNWNYQYTADQDDILDKQQELLDAENEWYNIAKQQVQDVTGEIVSTWQECRDAINDVYTDMTLTDEERAAKAQEIYEYYCEKIKDLEREKGVALQDIVEGANHQLETAADATSQYMVDIATEFDTTWADTLAEMTENTTQFQDIFDNALDNCNDSLNNYGNTLSDIAGKTGTDLQNLQAETENLANSNQLLYDSVSELIPVWWDMISNIRGMTEEFLALTDQIYAAIDALRQLAGQSLGGAKAAGEFVPDSQYWNNLDFSTLQAEALKRGDEEAYDFLQGIREQKIDYLEGQGVGAEYYIKRGAEERARAENMAETGNYTQESWGGLTYDEIMELLRQGMASFDTGGYTGSFDNSRMAFLHEKELVLNQEDTGNLLAAVSTVRLLTPELLRSIETLLDGQALNTIAYLGSRAGVPTAQAESQPVEQDVHIEVSFPSVTDRVEIEEALANLINDASQWANRRT